MIAAMREMEKMLLDNITYIPCNPKNIGGTRKASDIKYLVYHYTGNDGDHDTANAIYYRDNVVQASAHYFVDDDSITQSVLDTQIAWAVGGKKWNDCAQTGGGTLYGIAKNANSISIEMCDTERNGVYNLSEQTKQNAILLGKMLMKKYDIPIERVIRHFDVTGKHCPAYFMDNTKWAAFKALLTESEDDMFDVDKLTGEDCYAILLKANEYAATLALPQWAIEQGEYQKAVDSGIVNGGRPLAAITRLEAAVMAQRASEK